MTTLPDPQFPRMDSVDALPDSKLSIVWQDGSRHIVDLTGFIHLGKATAPLRDPAIFSRAELGSYGGSVAWAIPDTPLGGIGIGADQLAEMALEQAPFDAEAFRAWQERLGLTNQAAADVLGVALNTIKNYRSGATLPAMAAIACRHLESNRSALAARYVPRPDRRGRPASPAE